MALPARRRGAVAVALVALMAAVGLAGADFASDSKMCAEKLAVLATCLPVVDATATARAPTPDCCSGLREVLGDSKKCLCVLIKDRDDPAIGIKVNVTRAMDLPSACSVPAVLSDCPKLLHISPDSKEAEIFKQYAIHEGKNATAGTAGGKHTDAVSGEGRHTAVVFAVVVSGLLTSIFVLA
ncbi:non-specific lipid transfer protein GPI-anchored 13-like [Aegilops tauschii subsp. strangulata]|nr:non-specific lipid transfer protein GPI-anchored 13-like [Aegilops tauschii subsp. strangulata]